MALDTISVFDVMEIDNTQQRVASRRALALAHHRVESTLGRFLRAAQTEEEFLERLALVQEDFSGYVTTASAEVGHDHPEHIVAALKDHYRLAAQPVEFAKTPAEEQEEEEKESETKTASTQTPDPKIAQKALKRMAKKGRSWSVVVSAEGKQGSPLALSKSAAPDFRVMGPDDPNDATDTEGGAFDQGFGGNMGTCPDCGGQIEDNPDPKRTYYPDSFPPFACRNCRKTFTPTELEMVNSGTYPRRQGSIADKIADGGYIGDPINRQRLKREGPAQQGGNDQGAYPVPVGDEALHSCPGCGSFNHQSNPVTGEPECLDCGYTGSGNPYGAYDEMSDVNHRQRDLGPYGGRDAAINPSDQRDDSSREVTCPECGGDGKTAGDTECRKCRGAGKVPNFGDSMIDTLDKQAADDKKHNNTDLDGPEPKIDKRLWTPETVKKPDEVFKGEESIGQADHKNKDITEPIKAVNDDPLTEIGERHTERQKLPANSGDAGYSTGGEDFGPHTDTFGDKGQTDPVTRETISSDQNPLSELLLADFPSDQIVQAALQRY